MFARKAADAFTFLLLGGASAAHAVTYDALADAFRARVVDASTDSFVFELTGKPGKVDQFISLMVPLGLVEVARTGVAAIARGPDAMKR